MKQSKTGREGKAKSGGDGICMNAILEEQPGKASLSRRQSEMRENSLVMVLPNSKRANVAGTQ